MSDFDRIPALLDEISAECPDHRDPAWAELTFRSGTRRPIVTVYSACPDEFQEQKSALLYVRHCGDGRGAFAAIDVIAGPAEDPIALLERALDFVRTETPVPL